MMCHRWVNWSTYIIRITYLDTSNQLSWLGAQCLQRGQRWSLHSATIVRNSKREWEIVENNGEWWKILENNEKQQEIMRKEEEIVSIDEDSERRWETVRNSVRWWCWERSIDCLFTVMWRDFYRAKHVKSLSRCLQQMKDSERQWETVSADEKQWALIEDSEYRWKTVRNSKRR